MALSYVTPLRNAMVDLITGLIDAGAGPGTLRILDGAVPADANAAETGVLLSVNTMADPSAAAAVTGVWTANAIADDIAADATGTASYFRIHDSDANVVMQGTVGLAGADLNLSKVAFVIGDNVQITSGVITEGNP